MRYRAALLATVFLCGAAHAGSDKLIMAPPPDWVKPVALPSLPEKADEAPLRVLLADQQTRLEAGRVSNYLDLAFQLQTPQGLQAGNLSFPWNPETDELTVHKLLIHREGQIIDVLAAGQTFTVVRREPNLESAMLDGVLTANIQPEGLQVGDTLEYAITVASSDPVLKGHVEQSGAAWNGVPFLRTHFRAQWPTSLPVTMRQDGALPPLKPVKSGATTSIELSLENVEPVIPPRGAPARYAMGRIAEFSDFKSWSQIGALLAPLYDTAARIPAEGPLRTELEKIKAASTDPVKRAEAALALVQDRVRYVALLMGTGGLMPARAEETWARRYGDCKAKTALLLALLKELGIEAEAVAVNAISGDGLDQRLPMIGLFNHVLVRAHIGGRAYWLDGTRTGDASIARLRTPAFDWGLPLLPQNAALVRMIPEPLAEPDYEIAIDIDAREGLALPAPVKAQVILRGDDAIQTRLNLANLTATARDEALRDYWKGRLDDIEMTKVSAAYDAATGTELLAMEGKMKMDWDDGQYWTDWTRVGFEADFSRTAGTNAEAPFAVEYPSYSRTTQTIRLPPGFTEQNIFRKDPIDETVAGFEYRRKSSLKDDVFTIDRSLRAVAPEFPAKDAPATQARLKALYELSVSLRKPRNYRATAAELDGQMKTTLTTASAFVDRGFQLLERGRAADALKDLNEANKLDPKNAMALANRALAHFYLGDLKAAEADLNAAEAIDPKNFVIWNGRGLLAMRKGDAKAAVAAFDKALEGSIGNPWTMAQRGQAHAAAGNFDAALLDTAEALRGAPRQPDLYLLRANLYRRQGKSAEGIAEAHALMSADPKNGYAYVVASRILDGFGKRDDAMKAIGTAIEIKPDATALLNRAELRPRTDLAGRLADIDQALKLEPDMDDAHVLKAQLLVEQGNWDGSIKNYSALIDKRPENPSWRNYRGIAYAKIGNTALATADFVQARKDASSAWTLNAICYEKATAGVALDRALEECDAALAKEVDSPPILDSKGFVLLRLGRIDEAIAAFDKALAKVPNISESLYGRAIAWQRKGDMDKARADEQAALKINPTVQQKFEGYGVTLASANPRS